MAKKTYLVILAYSFEPRTSTKTWILVCHLSVCICICVYVLLASEQLDYLHDSRVYLSYVNAQSI
jgi:hypothetical protein